MEESNINLQKGESSGGEKSNELHGHEHKGLEIIVNGTQHKVYGDKVTYEKIVVLAFSLIPVPPEGETLTLNVIYENGPKKHPEGKLLPGHSVHIKEGMEFHVKLTNNS